MQGTKIILIEDEFISGTDLKNQLTKMGYEVLGLFSFAEDGIEFLEKNKGTENFPDAIILDIQLSGEIDGLEAVNYIYKGFDCGVIFLTGLGQLKVIEEIFEKKPVPFIIKPFDIYMVHTSLQLAMYQFKLEKRIKELERETANK
jgi:CheY-like chemotaxis protein